MTPFFTTGDTNTVSSGGADVSQGTDIVKRVVKAKKDVKAADALIREHIPFIKSETAKLTGRVPQEGRDDELSIAMMAFHEAIESYNFTRGNFIKFASVVIKRRLIDYMRKESKGQDEVSLSSAVTDDDSVTVADTIESGEDPYGDIHEREALKAELAELTEKLSDFGISLSDIAASCPKQERTLEACRSVLRAAVADGSIISELLRTKKLPMTSIAEKASVERKTLERHRKYIVTLLLIYSNGYDSIRDHLDQIFATGKGGEKA